jgi:hypothetical protein
MTSKKCRKNVKDAIGTKSVPTAIDAKNLHFKRVDMSFLSGRAAYSLYERYQVRNAIISSRMHTDNPKPVVIYLAMLLQAPHYNLTAASSTHTT